MSKDEIIKETSLYLGYILPDDWSEEKKEAKPIVAEKVVEAIKSGKKVEIVNAVIEGSLILKSSIVDSEVTIQRTKIRGPVDWSYTIFKQVLSTVNSIFESDAIFTEAIVEKDIFLDKATFHGKVNFSDFKVKGVFYSRSTTFKKEAIFAEATFEKRIEFDRSVFEGDAVFVDTRIGAAANFAEAKFKQQAHFDSSLIQGAAFFGSAIFEREATFGFMRIGGHAYFAETKFKQQAHFTSSQIQGDVVFDLAIFDGEADFVLMRSGGSVHFKNAEFKKQANFASSKIQGEVFFSSAIFEGQATFELMRIEGPAYFTETKFKQQAHFASSQIQGLAIFDSAIFDEEANFFLAQMGGSADFIEAEFKQRANFNSSQIKGITVFDRAAFAKDIAFKNASLGTVCFNFAQFDEKTKIDLINCIYDSIYPIPFWEQLMDRLDPYDRQPFNQLEETFRRAGRDELANDVYYMRKRRESYQKTLLNPIAWLTDRFLWLVTGYGVRLSRLLVTIFLILMVGTLILHIEGAVEPKFDIQMVSQATNYGKPHALTYGEAFWVSLNTFLPIEIPSGADWKPTSQIMGIQTWWGFLGIKFTTFATLLKLAGWIFVPVGIAGISGILKR